MATVTHIWKNQSGKKTPLPLMDDDHLCNAYRRCKETTYEPKLDGRLASEAADLTRFHWGAIPLETAEKWIPIFEAEAARRKLKLPKVDRLLYYQDLRMRMERKANKWEANKVFDDKFR